LEKEIKKNQKTSFEQMRKQRIYLILFLILPVGLWLVWLLVEKHNSIKSYFTSETLNLAKYSVKQERIQIKGIQRNLSGITFNPDTGSLFAVIDEPTGLVELSKTGRLLRRVKLNDFVDTEGICYLGANRFALVEERHRTVVFLRIDKTTRVIERLGQKSLTLAFGEYNNRGFEGIAGDRSNNRLYVVNEKKPRRIIEINEIPFDNLQPERIVVTGFNEKPPDDFDLDDFSGLHFDPGTGHLLLLSHESRQLIEISIDGRKVGSLPLTKGHAGLSRDVFQAEGVTMDENGLIYIISEPNLLYIFQPDEKID
jgi:uncharacterized protein YjiK